MGMPTRPDEEEEEMGVEDEGRDQDEKPDRQIGRQLDMQDLNQEQEWKGVMNSR